MQTERQDRRRPRSHFTYYPSSKVYGVYRDLEGVLDLTSRLIELGFGDEKIIVLQGEDGVRELDPDGRHHGIMARLIRSLQGITDERQCIEKYVHHLLTGCHVVAVVVPGRREVIDSVAMAFRETGGREVNYFGAFIVEPLSA